MSAVFAARRKRSRADFATTMAQGVQPLVRNEVTQNSPDIQMSGLFASQSARYRACLCIEVRSLSVQQIGIYLTAFMV